jgi:phosphatidylinositol alpha-mannosyltransferase
MKHLSVGLVLDDSLDRPDGVQQYVMTLGKWLGSQGHDVTYITGGSQSRTSDQVYGLSKNINVRLNGNRFSIPLPVDRVKIKSLLASKKIDVLHVQLPCSPWLAGRMVQAASPRTAIVGTFHIIPKSWLERLGSRALKLYEYKLLRNFQMVASVSQPAQTFARKFFGIDSVVVPNAIDLKPYQQATREKTNSKKVTVVFLGRLVERKGCQHLLKAVVDLKNRLQVKSFIVIIAGQGPLEASLKSFVTRNDLGSFVSFVGLISEADKPKLLASADIAVFPSTGGESFGIVLLEAMAAVSGVVLAGNNEGYTSVMYPHNDQLFDPKQSRLLADKLAYYIKSESARQSARKWQHKHVQEYSIEKVGPRIVSLYNQALRCVRDVR